MGDLGPGDVMCVRGDVSTLGRAYYEEAIRLDPSSGTSSGTATDPITVRPYPGEHVVIYPEDGDSLEFMGISYWHWEGFTFDEVDAGPIKFDAAASHNVLRDCKVHNGGWAAIVMKNGNENTIEGCQLHGFSHKPGEDACAVTIWDDKANVVRANEIYDFTADGFQLAYSVLIACASFSSLVLELALKVLAARITSFHANLPSRRFKGAV